MYCGGEWRGRLADRDLPIAVPRFIEIDRRACRQVSTAAKARDVVAAGGAPHDRADTTHVCVVDDAGKRSALTPRWGRPKGVVTRDLVWLQRLHELLRPRPGRPNSILAGKTRVP